MVAADREGPDACLQPGHAARLEHLNHAQLGRANKAVPERRDAIHAQVLRMCRKGRILNELLETIPRPSGKLDPGRADWLRHHPAPKVRKYAAYLLPEIDSADQMAPKSQP